jgi:hypothetical protein
MPFTRTPENPVIESGDVKVAVTDDRGKRLVVRISRQALEDADQAMYSDDEVLAAVDRHWPAASAVAERKQANGQVDGEGEIGVYSVDLVPPQSGPVDIT